MSKLGDISTLIINGNELAIKDEALTEIVNEIIEAIAINNTEISERINNLNNRAFDANIKISSANESEISNIQDGLYKIQYVTVTGSGDNATETLNNSAILIQKGTNQYLYKDGLLHSRTKENSVWGDWITYEGGVKTVNGKTGDVVLELEDIKPHDYSGDYLTTIALEDGTISFNIWKSMGTDMITSISYSTDNGETWTTTQNQDNKEEHLAIAVNVNEGDKVLWKGDARQTGFYDEEDYGDYVGSFFSSTCEFNAEGNVMSLLYGDDFIGEDTLERNGQFGYLFSDYDSENECKIVNAKSLSLPATTLTDNCYQFMFSGCTSLTSAPELPATTLTDNCYQFMFYGCTSLTSAPELPATTLAGGCYTSMFSGCTSIVNAPELPATTLASSCYSNMFNGCTSLVTAPELPATTLADDCYNSMFKGCTSLITAPILPATTLAFNCYSYMFQGCTSLVTAPELPATTLATYCYDNMFQGCTSLTTAPELSATTLANYCYQGMLNGCTSLTTAPELPATTLASGCYGYMFGNCTKLVTAPELPATTLVSKCYAYMFNGCTRLNYVKAMFTTTPSNTYTNNWVRGVASTGTFVKNDNATWDVTGAIGVPEGWSIYTESEYKEVKHYEISSLNVSHIFVKNIIVPIIIWIDDFSEISIQEMYDNYVNENDDYKYKQYHLTQDTITIDNITYYIWEGNNESIYDYDYSRAYLLTTTNNYDELLSQSLYEDLNNEFTSFGGFLNKDSEESYVDEINSKQYLLDVQRHSEDLYIHVDNINLRGIGDDRTIEDYIDDPETCGCNPYKLTGNTIDIDGESYYIWERTDDENHDYSTVHYLLTTTNDRETLLSTSVEANPNNLVVKPNNCIFALMDEDNEIYKTSSKNVIVKVE